jgi:hypothetical protein
MLLEKINCMLRIPMGISTVGGKRGRFFAVSVQLNCYAYHDVQGSRPSLRASSRDSAVYGGRRESVWAGGALDLVQLVHLQDQGRKTKTGKCQRGADCPSVTECLRQ